MLNYILFYLIILPLSYLPFSILYALSDLLYFFVYRIAGYRRSVVHTNLKNSFPDKSEIEIVRIEKEFFHHFCDLIVESMKAFTISEGQAQRRFKSLNPELPDKYFDQGKNIAICAGHYGNWELFAVTLNKQIKHKPVALYTTLTNKFFNKKIAQSRSKYGLKLLSIKEFQTSGIKHFANDLTATIFLSDQSPRRSQKPYWVEFLNQETAVQFGIEKFSMKYKAPVIFGEVQRIRRGYYGLRFHLICDDPDSMPVGTITEKHTKMLESIVQKKPAYWLWSHKRWKLKKPAEENLSE